MIRKESVAEARAAFGDTLFVLFVFSKEDMVWKEWAREREQEVTDRHTWVKDNEGKGMREGDAVASTGWYAIHIASVKRTQRDADEVGRKRKHGEKRHGKRSHEKIGKNEGLSGG